MRGSIRNFRLALETLVIVAIIVGLRAVIFALGFPGLSPTALVSSIIGGGIFVMGLVIAGTLSDYKDAERAPTDLAAGLYAILRETESMNRVWGKPDMHRLRARLVEVVDRLRHDIDAGNTRDCQTAIEDLSDSFIELEESDVPANYVVRLRQEQAGLRKAALRIYHIQREEFLPSAYAMIVSFVILIFLLLLFTTIEGPAETLVTVGFLAFFFVYLLRLLNVINKPFKVGQDRADDDVSLFLLYEFVVHARLADADLTSEQVVEIAEHLERIEDNEQVVAEEMEAAGSNEGEALADLEEVVDAAVASAQAEESDGESRR
jgi:ABC-type multidrug transport system fused ATPase/permease subunit